MNRDIVNTAPATRLTIADVYFQDDFRVTKKLTLNLALRWDLISMYNDVNNHQSNLNMNTGLLDVATAGNRGPNVDTNYHNFAPQSRLRLFAGPGARPSAGPGASPTSPITTEPRAARWSATGRGLRSMSSASRPPTRRGPR